MGAMLGHRGLLLSKSASSVALIQSSALHAAVTFARNTTGTYFDSTGVMQTAAINAPRFEYDPATLDYLGLLIEPQRTNLFTSSNAFSGGPWIAGSVSVFADESGPTGVMSRLVPTATTADNHYIYRSDFAGTDLVTATIYAKSTGLSYLLFAISDGYYNVSYNIAAGTVAQAPTAGGGGLSGFGASIQGVGGGYYRALYVQRPFTSLVMVPSTTQVIEFTASTTGDGVAGIAVGAIQYEVGTRATSYIPTSGTTVTRADDIATFPTSAINVTAGTFVMEHDCPAGDPLLGDGATAILTSQGPGKIALAYDATGTMVVHAGAAGTTGAALSLGATLRILGTSAAQAIGHCKSLTWYPGKQSEAWMQGQTA